MVSLIALVLADLAVSGHDRQLKDAQAALIAELERQILDDGGHVSRNPSVLADLILDLLPLGQCFQARGFQAPEEIADVVKKALAFLRFMRLGDGMLARFNGVSTGSPAGLATVLGYSGGELEAVGAADASGYARLERGETIIIADIGSPPALEVATEAQAGALSFEMTSRARLVFVNGGFPGPADQIGIPWRGQPPATTHFALRKHHRRASSGTPNLKTSSAGCPFVAPTWLPPVSAMKAAWQFLPAVTTAICSASDLMHFRRIALSLNGDSVEGVDRLEPPQGNLRLKADLPYAIHFHLHPDCRCERLADRGQCRIRVQDGQVWTFTADGADLTIEDGLYFVDSAGPRPSLQIVLRGATYGETEVRWRETAEPSAP